MIVADLHIHTDVSDCSMSLEKVINLAKQKNLTHIAITNHDTVKNLDKAIKIGQENGICVIAGVEISAFDYKRDRKVHILGYGFDLEAKNIKSICDGLLYERNKLALNQIDIIRDMGYDICQDDVRKYSISSEVIYKPHIMRALVDKGYSDNIYSKLYEELFGKSGKINASIEYVDVFKAVEAIKKDGGFCVVAHPGQLNSYELIEELVEVGLDGIEKYHHSHDEKDFKKIDKLASKYNLILTGGSDFHGDYGNVELGCNLTPQESVKFLLKN
jgi:hypothetical protein